MAEFETASSYYWLYYSGFNTCFSRTRFGTRWLQF
uniref:Uncharacterized protein n=1 Tax=Rhizophora mucronata TaxID=61149 RepID=A0A2P2P2X4_RHIMU